MDENKTKYLLAMLAVVGLALGLTFWLRQNVEKQEKKEKKEIIVVQEQLGVQVKEKKPMSTELKARRDEWKARLAEKKLSGKDYSDEKLQALDLYNEISLEINTVPTIIMTGKTFEESLLDAVKNY